MRDRLNSLTKHLPDLSHSNHKKDAGAPQGMTLPLGLPHVHRRLSLSGHQHEIRETKKFLRDQVRCDWTYPPLPRYQIPVRTKHGEDGVQSQAPDDVQDPAHHPGVANDDAEDKVAGFRFYQQSNHDRETLLHRHPDQLAFTPAAWRERDYSSEETPENENSDAQAEAEDPKDDYTYKFDNPDSVGEELTDIKLTRKRKRQVQLDEEVTWNDGLAHWLARRDAWCCAHTSAQVDALEPQQAERTGSTSLSATSSSSFRSSTDSSETDGALEPNSTPSTTPDVTSEAASSSEPSIIPTEPPVPPSEILVPVAPPMLANHPVRRRITTETYPEIYSKIILQSRTPSVPINLLTMTRAMVQGWKDDGEWPPRPMQDMSGNYRRHSRTEATLRHGVKAVGRALRITGADTGIAAG